MGPRRPGSTRSCSKGRFGVGTERRSSSDSLGAQLGDRGLKQRAIAVCLADPASAAVADLTGESVAGSLTRSLPDPAGSARSRRPVPCAVCVSGAHALVGIRESEARAMLTDPDR